MEDKDFDLKKFQSEVYRNYKYSLIKQVEMAISVSVRGIAFPFDTTSGLIKKTLYRILNPIGVYFYRDYFKKPFFVARESKALEIINNPKIKQLLCPMFKRKISADFFKEELEMEVIIILTTTLTKRKISREFSIEKNKELFAMTTYKILQKGIENYCLDK